MSMLVMLAAAFAAIIALGTAAAAVSDAVERWLAERARRTSGGGGSVRCASAPDNGPRPVAGRLVAVRRGDRPVVHGTSNRGVPAAAAQGGADPTRRRRAPSR